jgi:transcriptional regulator with XRE-family HTH domain
MTENNGKLHNDFKARLAFAWFRRQAQLGRKIEQSEVAKLVGKELGRESLTQGAVSHWLSGRNEPDLATIAAIAKALDVDPGWLAFGQGREPDDPAAPIPMPRSPRGPDD